MKKSKSQKTIGEKKTTEEKAEVESPDKPDAPEEFLVVGIGASAGGIRALKAFFENVPADSGMAYVVILHLSPDHDSQLASVLQVVSKIPVTQVTQRVRVAPNRVYVVPPNQHLGMEDGHIVVSPNLSVEERRAPVDIFFRTLAESHRARAVAVILSGTGADGSMGLKRVKERGGAAFVQNPREAEFSEMPRNSIATDLIDRILNVGDIPARIAAYKKSLGKVEIPVEAEQRPEGTQQALREIFTQLRIRTGHDFSNYKRPTMLRRIERRINVFDLPDLASYARFVRENRDEATALLKDLLISVTNFFRDKEAFRQLEHDVLPKIFHGKTREDQVRIWVCGCATGEEAYSLAMLCAERAVGGTDAPAVQIFATDIDERAITTAREGFYTLIDAADVSPERLRRFFIRDNDGYRIRRELREMVLFADHNVIKDPSFSRLDAVTCRNMLIYLDHTAQKRVMETFHFALNPGGFLFLGNSESVDGAGDLYATVSKESHIYQSRHAAARIAYPVPEPAREFANSGFTAMRAAPPQAAKSQPTESNLEENGRGQNRTPERVSFGDLHQRLLELYAPPSIVVNEEYDIVHLSERAGRYLQIAGGEPTKNLLKLIRPELRLGLRSALYRAAQNQTNVEVRNLKIRAGERDDGVNILVRPVFTASERRGKSELSALAGGSLAAENPPANAGGSDSSARPESDSARGFILVLFESVERATADAAEKSEEISAASNEPIVRQLEEELARTESQLRQTVERFEAQTEEFRASNEELQAANEELHSAAEELETSKEELQSVNEELITVNQELKIKIEELSQSTGDYRNLIFSTDIATIFLDRSFRVNTFTPAASRIFNLIPADAGRPLSDITHRLETDGLLRDAETVLETLQTVEREARASDGRTYLLRVLPYRAAEDRIGGVVATFLDITERKRAEVALRRSEEQKRLIIESAKDYAIFTLDLERRVSSWNRGAEAMMGYAETEIVGESGDIIFTPEDRKQGAPEREAEIALMRGVATNERIHVRRDGSGFWGSGLTRPLRDEAGNAVGFVKVMRDLTEAKRTQDALRESEEKYHTLFDSIDEGVSTIELIFDENERVVDYYLLEQNQALTEQTGLPREAVGKRISEVLPNLEAFWFETFERVARTGEPQRFEHAVAGLDRNWFEVYVSRVGGTGSRMIVLVYNNITTRKRTEANLAFLAETSADFASLLNAEEIMERVGSRLAGYLNLSRCNFSVVDEESDRIECIYDWRGDDSMPGVSGAHRVSAFLSAEGRRHYAAGKLSVISDTRNSSMLSASFETLDALGVRSIVDAPHLDDGRWKFLLTAARSEAGEWREDEVALIRELAERIYIRIERARAEQAVRESEMRLRLATEAGGLGAWEWHLKTDEVFWNEQHFILFGMEPRPNPLKSEEFFNRVHPDERERVAALLQKSIEEKIVFETNFRAVLDSGETRWMSGYGRVVQETDGGEPVKMSGLMFDITDRKRAEAAVRESEIRYLAIIGQSTAGITELDLDGYHALANPGYCETLGYTEAELLKMTLRDITHPDDYPHCLELFKDTIKTGTAHVNEKRIIRKNGEIIWITDSISRITDAHGKALRVATIAIDITNRRRAEEALAESEERLRLLVESASDYAIFTTTIDGRIDSWNTGAEKVFGWTEAEMLGKAGAVIFTPEDRGRGEPEKEMRTALRDGRAPDERFHLRKDGSRFYVSGVTTVLKNDDDNAAQGFVKIARDMTEQIEAEKAVREKELLQKLVGAQEDERRRIARDLHDELGQQLTALRLKLDVARKLCDGDELRGKIDEIERIAKSIDNGVDFLAWELRPAALDHLGLVAALENYVKQWSHHSGVTAELLGSKLKRVRFAPETETNLYRIVQEALNNVHKHARAKTVEVVLEKRNDLIVLIVEDDGIGFNPKDKKKRQKGMGLLGMRERAALIGGELEIESAPKEGTTVYARVPAATVKRKKLDEK